jgi:NodT family efflux transporter outer membrane factor (OMF) lipoprotein
MGDAQLDALVDRALAHNANLGLAAARVAQALAEQQLAESALRPSLDATLGATSSRSLLSSGPGHTRSVQPGLQASWEPDLWGRLGNLAQAGRAQTAASQADEAGARVALAAQVVQAYVALRALDAQLAVAQATERSRVESEQLTADQARTGYASQLPLAQAQAETASVRQNIAQLDLAIRRQEDALRLLTGDPPGPVPRGLPLAELRLPQPAVAQPSALLRRRPDIAAAEARLAAGDARLAAQRAAFLPHVQLSASVGSLLVNALDYNPLTVWSLGASALAPLFNGGRLQAQMDAVAAQRDQLAWGYRDTVLHALDEVQASLGALPRIAQQREQAGLREAAVARALDFSKDRYEAGYASYLETLDAQRSLFAVQLSQVSLKQSELDNLVALYRALGGGWQAAQ